MANPIARSAALALLCAVVASAQTRRLLPVDESARDPKLVAYLAKFKTAVAHRDRNELLPLVAPEIKLGFGGEDGVANFQPDWPMLDRMLSLGGAWKFDTFVLPYVFARFPENLDPFNYAAVTGAGVWLRAHATATSEGIRQLSYELVEVAGQGEEWWKVTTFRGEEGFISAKYVASPVGYRAFLQTDRTGQWKLFALLAGD